MTCTRDIRMTHLPLEVHVTQWPHVICRWLILHRWGKGRQGRTDMYTRLFYVIYVYTSLLCHIYRYLLCHMNIFICHTRPPSLQYITHSHMWQDSPYVCLYVWHDWFMWIQNSHMCDTTHSYIYEWHLTRCQSRRYSHWLCIAIQSLTLYRDAVIDFVSRYSHWLCTANCR